MVDLVINGGKIATPRGIIEAGVAVKNGIIVSIAKDQNLPSAEKTINVNNKIICPGVIDGHVHMWDPGATQREDFETGTIAAAAGGVTTVIEHPLTTPPVLDAHVLNEKRDICTKKAVVDFALHGGVTGESIAHVEDLWKAGPTGLKMFMCFSVYEFPHIYDGDMLDALIEIARVNGLALIHAENDFFLSASEKKLKAQGRKDWMSHVEWRPPMAEIEAISRAIFLFEESKAKGLFVHISTCEGVKRLQEAKNRGVPIFTESCPQYFYLTIDDLKEKGPWVKFAPPLRDKENTAGMWKLLNQGLIDAFGSDHCPYERSEKEAGLDDMWKAPNGIPGVETILPLMLTGVSEGRVSLMRLIEVLCEKQAQIFGLYPRKGAIEVGSDADFTIIDMKKEATIKADQLKTRCGWTPYEGIKVKGMPTHTIVRGEVIMEDSKVIGKAGYGEFLARNS